MKTEAEFHESIDACFRYTDLERGLALVAEGCAISTNAAFAVVEELARPPLSADAPIGKRLKLLEEVGTRLNHPLAAVVFPIAETMIRGAEVSPETARKALMDVIQYPGEFSALNTLYFSCDDADGVVEEAYELVLDSWRTA